MLAQPDHGLRDVTYGMDSLRRPDGEITTA